MRTRGPTPVSAVLSGLLLNVALYAGRRCKVLVEGSLHTTFARELMMGFGLLSVVIAALLLSRQKDIKRLFAYSSIEHMGIITFAFGIGGAVANFAATAAHDVHSLTSPRSSSPSVTPPRKRARTDGRHRGLGGDQPGDRLGADPGYACHPRMPPFGVFAEASSCC